MNKFDELCARFPKRKVSCFIIHEKLEDLFKQLPDFKPDTVFKDKKCPDSLQVFYENFVGLYKDTPVIKTDKLKDNEVYALYKGLNDFEQDTIFLPYEAEFKV